MSGFRAPGGKPDNLSAALPGGGIIGRASLNASLTQSEQCATVGHGDSSARGCGASARRPTSSARRSAAGWERSGFGDRYFAKVEQVPLRPQQIESIPIPLFQVRPTVCPRTEFRSFCKSLAQIAVVPAHSFCWNTTVVIAVAQQNIGNALKSRRGIALLLLGLFLFVQAMTQFESLHHAVHPDSHQPNHQCAVTMLQDGQVDVPPSGLVSVVVPRDVEVAAVRFAPMVFVSFDFILLPSCGPPALLS